MNDDEWWTMYDDDRWTIMIDEQWWTMMDDDGNFLSYTNKQQIRETKRLKYQALLKNYKDKLNITTRENTLSVFNSKTCNLEKFKEYITEKIKVNQELYTSYQNEKFRQYKWYAYINPNISKGKQ